MPQGLVPWGICLYAYGTETREHNVANAILNTMIDNIRGLDTDIPGGPGDTVAVVTAVVAELLTDMTGGADDVRLEAALAVTSMMASRVDGLHREGELDDDQHAFAMDLCLEFSLALCRLHS